MNESFFEGTGGLKIFTRSWHPAESPRGVVVIVHGFNSHGGYYNWAAEQFVAENLAVYALDLRGRGKSEGERFYVESFSDYVGDVAAFVVEVKNRERDLPVFLLGHSAGGVISCLYALSHQNELTGLICESFAFQLPAPDFALAVMKGLSYIAPHFHALKLSNADFSRDEKTVETMNNDPLIADERQPLETLAELVRADERLNNEFSQITLPLLILHGTGDKAAEPDGSRLFYDAAGSRDKTLKLYDGHFHDLLNDIDKEKVMTDIRNWIFERISADQEAFAA